MIEQKYICKTEQGTWLFDFWSWREDNRKTKSRYRYVHETDTLKEGFDAEGHFIW